MERASFSLRRAAPHFESFAASCHTLVGMRSRLRDRPRWRHKPLLVCLALAFALHLLIGMTARTWLGRRQATRAKPKAPIQLVDRRRATEAIREARKLQQKQESPRDRGRLVSLPPPKQSQVNDRASLMAADAHRVDKETVSKERELSSKEAAEHRQEERASADQQALPTTEAEQARQPAANRPSGHARRVSAKKGRRDGPGARTSQQQAVSEHPPGPRRALGLSDLVPSVAQLAQRAGAPVADVSSDDAPEGDVTALNTRSFRFAGFFDRVSQRLRPHWQIYEALSSVRKRGQILMEHEAYRTTVHVVLDERGQLVSVTVRDPSGIGEFDAAGKNAIEAAAPYLHPPAGLLDQDRQVAFDFEFRVSVQPGNLFEGMGWRQDLP